MSTLNGIQAREVASSPFNLSKRASFSFGESAEGTHNGNLTALTLAKMTIIFGTILYL
jgi:hypothetical protein